MSTHNISFYGEQEKIILQLSPNTFLIWSTELTWREMDYRSGPN